MMKNAGWALLAGAVVLGAAGDLSSESVTLMTYYPAPSGVYARMITTDSTFLARESGEVAIGFADPVPGIKLQVVGDASVDGGLLTTGDTFLARDGGGVGVGTTEPYALLDVAGSVRIADGTHAEGRVLTADADGFARWAEPGAGFLECRTVGNAGQWAQCVPGETLTSCGTYQSGEDDQIELRNGMPACRNDEDGVWARCCRLSVAPIP